MPDLSTFDTEEIANQGVELELLHPVTDEPFDPSIKLTVLGIDSKEYKKASHAAQNRRLKRRRSGNLKIEDFEEETLNCFARCIVSWENVEWDGKPLECNYQNAKMLLEKFSWFREQVAAFMQDITNFLAPSKKNSKGGVSGDSLSSTTPGEISLDSLKS